MSKKASGLEPAFRYATEFLVRLAKVGISILAAMLAIVAIALVLEIAAGLGASGLSAQAEAAASSDARTERAAR